jgi:uncharacterized protein (TIGR00251 family)
MQYKIEDTIKSSHKGVLVDIHVISQSKGKKIEFNPWEPRIKIKVKNASVKGRANQEVVDFFKKILGNCEITAGCLTPKKTLLITGCTNKEVVQKLEKQVEKDKNSI